MGDGIMATNSGHDIFLCPGFFGFATVGRFGYWSHVERELERLFGGEDARIFLVATPPTASLVRRARVLAQALAQHARPGTALHLVGHSSGGLDARLLVTPSAHLGAGLDLQPLVERVSTVVTVATPHRGAPLASAFTSMMGQSLLEFLSIATVYLLTFGRLPLSIGVKLAGVLATADGLLGLQRTILHQLDEQLLGDFTPERRDALRHLVTQMAADQALLAQLAPDAMDIFAATVPDRPGVRYGCVLTRAPAPGVASTLSAGLDPYAQAQHGLFHWLQRTSGPLPHRLAPALTKDQRLQLCDAYGAVPGMQDNDAIVPTLSQVHGEVVAALKADHLDVLGHFRAPDATPPHYDWLVSHADFDPVGFARLWHAVADFMVPPP